MNANLEPIEIIEKNRRNSLIGLVFCFGLWQIGQIVTLNFKEQIGEELFLIFSIITLVGSLSAVGLFLYFYKVRSLLKKHPQLCSQINDERACHIKNKALAYGFSGAVVSSSLLLALSFITNQIESDIVLTGAFVSHFIMVFTIITSLVAYLVLDNNE
jgi:hypothetical protein